MSNRVYLYCTNFPGLPEDSQFGDFFRASGIEYEAEACIPLFWMCLFSANNIRIAPASQQGQGHGDPGRPYAYLFSPKAEAVSRLKSLAALLQTALGRERFAVYAEWVSRIESEPFDNVLVRTEALDQMGDEGELERNLRKAYRHLADVHAMGLFRMSDAMDDIAGLWAGEVLSECEGIELAGSANSQLAWPPRFMPERVPEAAEKSSWRFWKKN